MRRRRIRRITGVVVLAAAGLILAACNDNNVWVRGGFPKPVTVQGDRVLKFWQGSLLAALIVGAFVTGLILWACIFHRKRGDDLPRQVRYNLPVEILYTAVPVVIVSILFYFTAIDENFENKLGKADMTVQVVGFQWSWEFDYQGQNLSITGRPGQPPTLVLPVGEKIRFEEVSPDVIHSFWVVPWLFKRDVIPGRTNVFQVTVNTPGTFQGRCAEYCGIDHDRMLFTVKAMPKAQYLTWLANEKRLAASHTDPGVSTGGFNPGRTQT